MAAAAANKVASKKDTRYPEIEEDALQFILDAVEASISKYSNFLQVSIFQRYVTFILDVRVFYK